MADLDAELLDRVARWCAEAGRTAGEREIRRALEPLGWDALLAVRALLADPPPVRPLGPHALADMARGTPADVAAEREREGRYGPEERDDAPPPAASSPAAAPRPARRGRAKGKASVVIRRARDRAPAPSPAEPTRAPIDALLLPEGRAELERLVRRLGARRRTIAAALAERWQRPDGAPPGEADVAALLDHHGLARAFERRERDELLHTVRAAGGVRAAAAERLGLDAPGLEAALARLGAAAEAERIREHHRAELRARATLAERVALLVGEEARLRDLELLEAFEADLRARLPEHVRALRASAAPLRDAFAASLSLASPVADALAARFGLELGGGRDAPGAAEPRPRPRGPRRPTPRGAPRGAGPRGAGTRPRPPRPGDARRPSQERGGAPRAERGARPRPSRPGDERRRPAPERGGGPRTSGPRRPRSGPPTAGRPARGRPGGRPTGGRPGGRRPR